MAAQQIASRSHHHAVDGALSKTKTASGISQPTARIDVVSVRAWLGK